MTLSIVLDVDEAHIIQHQEESQKARGLI